MRNEAWLGLVLAALPLSACALDEGVEGDVTTAETEQASSWGLFWNWQRHDNLPTSSNSVDMGDNDNQSCFLAGVGGNIQSVYGAAQGAGVLYTIAKVGIYTENDHLHLEASTGSGTEKLHGRAMCLNTTSGRTSTYEYNSHFASSATQMKPDDGSYVCFLRRILNTEFYYNDVDFGSSTDEVLIFSLGGYWYLGGSGNVHAEAQCIKVQQNLGEWNWTGGTINLAQNDLNPGTQCFLTGYKGTLRTNDYDNGAFISYDSGLLQYNLTVSSGKRAWARCVK